MSGPVANNIFRASGVVAAAAGGLNWNSTILTALTTFTVTVANPGSGNRYYIDGVLQQTVNLLEGFTYKFDQADSSNTGHPLRFSTTSGGSHSGGSEYTTGVTTSGTPGQAGAYTQIVVASGAPVLYYYCTAHSGMGGTANTIAETVEANRGYWIDTTSATCTITLPSSAEKGNQIILVDYARTWGTNKITIDSNGLNFQGQTDIYTVEYSTSGEVLNIIYSDSTKGWIPQDDDEVADAPVAPATQKAIFAFGDTGSYTNISNLVGSNGVVGSDVTGVGTARGFMAAASYGGDKAIFGFGTTGSRTGVTNLVNNSGVVASDTSAVGTAKADLSASGYGDDLAIFAFGNTGSMSNSKNLVNNSGVVASDTSGAGTARQRMGAARYGTGTAIFAYGENGGKTTNKNLISDTGVIASDTSGAGTALTSHMAAQYGTGTAIFAYGQNAAGAFVSVSNLVNSSGVIASDVSGVGTARNFGAATNYGGDKAIFGFQDFSGGSSSVTNLVNSSGVVQSDVTGVGTARRAVGAAGYSYSA